MRSFPPFAEKEPPLENPSAVRLAAYPLPLGADPEARWLRYASKQHLTAMFPYLPQRATSG